MINYACNVKSGIRKIVNKFNGLDNAPDCCKLIILNACKLSASPRGTGLCLHFFRYYCYPLFLKNRLSPYEMALTVLKIVGVSRLEVLR